MIELVEGFFAPWLIYAALLGLHMLLPRGGSPATSPIPQRRAAEVPPQRPLGIAAAVGIWVLRAERASCPGTGSFPTVVQPRRFLRPGADIQLRHGRPREAAPEAAPEAEGRSVQPVLRPLGEPSILQRAGRRQDVPLPRGAVMLSLNILSFFAHHLLLFGSSPSAGVELYCFLFMWFIVDYLIFERVHLYTYDIFAERMGFKLGWGCLAFYPYFYAIGLWATAELPDPHPPRGSRPRSGSSSSRAGYCRAAPTCRNTFSRPAPSARSSAFSSPARSPMERRPFSAAVFGRLRATSITSARS